MRWSDFDDLVETYFQLYEERERGEPIGITLFGERPSRADEVEWFARGYRRVLLGDEVWIVAEVEGRTVGSCVIGRAAPNALSEQAHIGVLGILVRREYRGRGVGTALLTHALEAAKEKFEVVRLDVFSVNEGARRLYERFGFVLSGHVPRAIKRGDRYYDEDQMVLRFDRDSPGPANA